MDKGKDEIKTAETDFELAPQIGDPFIALGNVAGWKYLDAELCVAGAKMKFKKLFAYVEQGAKKQGQNLSTLSPDEMETFKIAFRSIPQAASRAKQRAE